MRDPCKICLVVAACRELCETKTKYLIKKKNIIEMIERTSKGIVLMAAAIVCFVLIILMVVDN